MSICCEYVKLFLLYITCFVFYYTSQIKTMMAVRYLTLQQIENIGPKHNTRTQPLSTHVYLHSLPTDFAYSQQTITISCN